MRAVAAVLVGAVLAVAATFTFVSVTVDSPSRDIPRQGPVPTPDRPRP